MDVTDIVKSHLEKNGFDGLYRHDSCACVLGDLAPCGNMMSDCEAGYKLENVECTEHSFHVGSEKGGVIICSG
mgnify:CR=1 FL=1